jgi:antitoxin MazE
MQTHLIQIGNSMGIRIPKNLIKECGLSGELELRGAPGALLIKQISKARNGWEKAFAEMAERGDDKFLDGMASFETSWDRTEWKW